MKKELLFRLSLLAALPVLATGALNQQPSAPVVIGESVDIASRILNESRSLLIAKPAGYEKAADAYPVLYLLDGEAHFHYVSGIVRFMAASERIPGMLVVAIASGNNAQRTRDLTPRSSAEIDNRFSPGSGGADAFLSFIAGELIPYIERTYRTRPYRILAGHSFGGLFALHALVRRPDLFQAYIAMDPTLSWNNGAILPQTELLFSKAKGLRGDLYLTAASYTGSVPADVRNYSAMLEAKAPAGFRWKCEWMKDETHTSISLPAIHHGLDAIFDGWHLADPLGLFNEGGLEAIHRHFRDGGRRCGYERATPPFTISLVVAGLIKLQRLDEAGTVLLHDPKAYPPAWNQLDALARAYEERGDAKQAIRYYQMSLKENPRNERARRRLEEMGAAVPEVR